MFSSRPAQSKRSSPGWWSLILLLAVGLLFLLGQTFYPPVPAETSPPLTSPANAGEAARNMKPQEKAGVFIQEARTKQVQEDQPQDLAEDDSFLAEYDPNTVPFFDNETAPERPMWQVSGELALKLALVVGLVYAIIAGLRWLQRGGRGSVSAGSTIRVLETTGLAPGRALHLVVVGEKTLLIGATDHQLCVLAELEDASRPLPDESSEFHETLASVEQSMAPVFDWQVTLNNLRAGVQRIQESMGG